MAPKDSLKSTFSFGTCRQRRLGWSHLSGSFSYFLLIHSPNCMREEDEDSDSDSDSDSVVDDDDEVFTV